MLKSLQKWLPNRKKEGETPDTGAEAAEPSAASEPVTGRKKPFVLYVVIAVAVMALGFTLSGVFMTSGREAKQVPLNMKLGSNVPSHPTPDSPTPPADLTQQSGQVTQPPSALPGASSGATANTNTHTAQPASATAGQAPAPLIAKRDVDSKPVGEFDPFKSEFKKKYEDAEKKEKKGHSKHSGTDSSLSELEKGLKASPVKQMMPLVQMPPAPPPSKELKLNVHGVVVSRSDSYALTDRGIIRQGSSIDSFQVERIEFDKVTLRSRDNNNDVRYLFIAAKSTQSAGAGTAAVTQITPR